jgi:acetylornithine deacetylase
MNALAYAQDLVRLKSPSSVSNCAVSDYAEQALRAIGFETERVEYDDARGVRKVNVLGRRGSAGGPGFALFAHTDTVPADQWFEGDPYQPFLRDGRLYGRGSCDMKGPLACILAAAAAMPARQLARPLYVVCTADEEIGYGGAEAVAARSDMFAEIRQGCGVIAEPTRLEVVHAHKGCVGFVATATGRAAHSSTSAGINANLAIIPFLVEMKQIHDELQSHPQYRNEQFDPPTPGWNIGVNDGNTPVNVTAPRSVATVYWRPMPGQDTKVIIERVERAAAENRLQLEIRGTEQQPLYTDPACDFVQRVLAITGRSRAQTVSYGTDGAVFGRHMPLVVCGPGDIAQAHTIDEWIALDQLECGTDLFRRLIAHFCGEQ